MSPEQSLSGGNRDGTSFQLATAGQPSTASTMRGLVVALLVLLSQPASPQPQPGWSVPDAVMLSGEAKKLLDQAAVAYKVGMSRVTASL